MLWFYMKTFHLCYNSLDLSLIRQSLSHKPYLQNPTIIRHLSQQLTHPGYQNSNFKTNYNVATYGDHDTVRVISLGAKILCTICLLTTSTLHFEATVTHALELLLQNLSRLKFLFMRLIFAIYVWSEFRYMFPESLVLMQRGEQRIRAGFVETSNL